MGYRITSLSNLPCIDGIDLYIFILGEYSWHDDFLCKINENFNALAKRIGPNTAIISGHDGIDLCEELAFSLEQASWDEKSILSSLVRAGQHKPAILILGAHPQKLKKDDLILYAPLDVVKEKFFTPEKFFNELCAFSLTKSSHFLDNFKENNIIKNIMNSIDININMGLIGFNISNTLRNIKKIKSKSTFTNR